MFVSVIIPSKNEPLLQDLTDAIHKSLSKMRHEIIIVEKGKPPKVKGAKVMEQRSDGLGNAVMEGVNVSKGDVIVTMDGDFSTIQGTSRQ